MRWRRLISTSSDQKADSSTSFKAFKKVVDEEALEALDHCIDGMRYDLFTYRMPPLTRKDKVRIKLKKFWSYRPVIMTAHTRDELGNDW